ncbi:MAG: hypothetical protein H0T89_17025 [Deltaproteobacteria bacterium]|nr:hypothetical protein [Deltaproteobacteria bacterium]MDQ3294992.1 hypothetical protein [Myxococcota bacterium]
MGHLAFVLADIIAVTATVARLGGDSTAVVGLRFGMPTMLSAAWLVLESH